uniref:Uncharacterized protein n=1 Tax=Ditylum brightwellii TaxID=49249 RepID=A0A7S1YZZ5_9STRA|mmetsp:Transcript_21456/g.31891  ORF Transcript_21456/g.31891 Transcript_21456/m.31891 type:complete len:136 (+) Transcript_21456:133-540(+)
MIQSPATILSKARQGLRPRMTRQDRMNRRSYHNNHSSNDGYVRPYSDSVPPKGYEWCRRCGIRLPKYQKKIGEPNYCYDDLRPRILWFVPGKICSEAWQYYRMQINVFLMLGLGIFGIPFAMPKDKTASLEREQT